MLQHILYRILTVLSGVCAIVFLVLAVLSLIPPSVDTGLTVKETLFVSSSPIDRDGKKYASQIQGVLTNESNKEIHLDALIIKVSDGKTERVISLTGARIPARVSHEILYEWEDVQMFDRINGVTVVVDGKEEALANATANMPFNFSPVAFLALCAIFALITVRLGKQCYYLIQEDQIKENKG